ncbi:MAG: nuclear transport factor 2 family protein [Actinobacteria bacterium]|nr:nuclear transport factor 2 family protein [Actinomycetota bacterium]
MADRDNLALVKRFYDAIARLDPGGLLDVLEPDLVAHVSDGLADYGGTHQGARAMLEKVWVPAHLTFRAMPTPDQFFENPPDGVAAIGFYRGRVDETGREFEAAFCHVFRCNENRIAELRQITDTARWMEALTPR